MLWYYADLEKKECLKTHLQNSTLTIAAEKAGMDPNSNITLAVAAAAAALPYKPSLKPDIDHCLAWRRFSK